jgi:uncharacterized protein (TIGR03435 family)
MAQAQSAPQAAAAPAKTMAFDVVSIRQNVSEQRQMGPPQFGPTPDGYRMTNAPLMLPILTAYVPQTGGVAFFTNDRITGLPDWLKMDRYDIDAKVSEEDLAEWQKPASQPAMLKAMLQALLVDRCKLVVHRESKEAPVYFLVVGKNGPKFKETKPDEPHPGGITLPFGGVIVPSQDGMKLFAAPMASVATLMSSMGNAGRPVQDKTGLTGKYDIVVHRPDMGPPQASQQGGMSAPDPGYFIFSVVEELGLKLESGKSSVETLVIDHIEKPSEN